MSIARFFWDMKDGAVAETLRILKEPQHPQYLSRIVTLLSRCDQPGAVFQAVGKEAFAKHWPRVRTYWKKRVRQSDFRDWWDTIYEGIISETQSEKMKAKGGPAGFLRDIGRMIRERRLAKGLTQKQLALSVGMKQPDISKIEEGQQNITLYTLVRVCRILEITTINI